MSTLSKNPVYSEFFDKESGEWSNHVELGKWADLMIIAPCTANTLSKMAHGMCDNLLIATYLSADCPVFFAPAMDLDMYKHPSTAANIDSLKSYGNIELAAEEGELASGLSGKGRMSEPETIFERVAQYLKKKTSLSSKRILVSAGPTHEKIDPVRFIGNYSSGKMGVAIANELAERGADVELVLGPVDHLDIKAGIHIHKVNSAQEMFDQCVRIYKHVDAAIMSAAVADYRLHETSTQKIKKSEDELMLKLVKNPDILMELGKSKKNQVLVGFALETENEYDNALTKLKKKKLDFIVLNSMNDKGAGFQKDTNKITIIENKGKKHTFETKPKTEVAKDIVNLLQEYLCV